MLAERTDPLSRYVMKVDMIDHVRLILVFFGTNFAKPSAPLDLLKVMAVIDFICKRWKQGLEINCTKKVNKSPDNIQASVSLISLLEKDSLMDNEDMLLLAFSVLSTLR